MSNPHNPYAAGANAYAKQSQKMATEPREIEANALLSANRKFLALQARWDQITAVEIEEALRFNRQIWIMFVDNAVETANAGQAVQFRTNIANIGMFVFNRSLEISVAPEAKKLDALININNQIATGLMTRPQNAKKNEASADTKNAIIRDA